MQQTSVQKTKKNQKKIGGMNMFKKMKHIKNEKGLTLIELLAVIVILAIIAAIAIPAIGNIINNTRDKAVLSEIQNALASAKIANADGTCDETCNGNEFEFASDKLVVNDTFEIVLGEDADNTTISVTLTDELSGTRIADAIEEEDGTYTDGATPSIEITEAALNAILD